IRCPRTLLFRSCLHPSLPPFPTRRSSDLSRVTPLIVIVGPTASGKSALGVHLAERLRGEVVACDSTQVYRHFDIGTAKPTWEERSEEHTSELQSHLNLVCRLLLEKKKKRH